MSRFDHLDGRTPVVVGAAEVVHRAGDGFVPTSATALMLEAARWTRWRPPAPPAALGPLVGEVLVPHGTWSEPDPGRALAVAIGAPGARSVRSELGVLQLSLLGRAASTVAAGELEAALVVGGENRWSGVVSGKEGRPVPEPALEAVAQEPDELVEPTDMIISPVEIERNLTTAAHQYAIVESALRHQLGRSVDEHQRWLGELWAGFARIAAEAPAGWDQRGLGPDDIAAGVRHQPPDRRALPEVARLAVERRPGRGAGRHVGRGRPPARHRRGPLGLPGRRSPCRTSSVPLPERDRAPPLAGDGRGAAPRCATTPRCHQEDLSGAPVDLYSCFPVAVEVQAQELGISPHRALTLTGGMTFGGGPFNNYALQGAAAMVRELRSRRRCHRRASPPRSAACSPSRPPCSGPPTRPDGAVRPARRHRGGPRRHRHPPGRPRPRRPGHDRRLHGRARPRRLAHGRRRGRVGRGRAQRRPVPRPGARRPAPRRGAGRARRSSCRPRGSSPRRDTEPGAVVAN